LGAGHVDIKLRKILKVGNLIRRTVHLDTTQVKTLIQGTMNCCLSVLEGVLLAIVDILVFWVVIWADTDILGKYVFKTQHYTVVVSTYPTIVLL
jgi:hypothetical protein